MDLEALRERHTYLIGQREQIHAALMQLQGQIIENETIVNKILEDLKPKVSSEA